MNNFIELKNVRVNNLKNISLNIPHNKFIVITGVSGSGKSSLAFDTLYAEGQRRYVESLSAYARQFLGRMNKPDFDYIKGLPPAIAVEQKVNTKNPRSTVGTSTEIYDYLRMLFARIGHTYSPISGSEVKRHTTDDIIRCITSYSKGTKFIILAKLHVNDGNSIERQLQIYMQQGYSRIYHNSEFLKIEDVLNDKESEITSKAKGKAVDDKVSNRLNSKGKVSDGINSDGINSDGINNKGITTDDIFIVIDRLSVDDSQDVISRITDSLETAFFEGNGACRLVFLPSNISYDFSDRFEADGIRFEEPNDNMFSFNSPIGACPTCEGFGSIIGIDEKLVIPNTELSVYDGCVQCWHGEKMSQWKEEFCISAAKDKFPIFEPYYKLTSTQKEWLWHGLPSEKHKDIRDKVCIDSFFQMVKDNQYKIQYRVMMSRYRGRTICPECHGGRLKKEADYVKINGKSLSNLVEMSVTNLRKWFAELKLNETESQIGKRLLNEINNRLKFLTDVGLGYLTLNRPSNTLSGGESQRINLTTALGSSLVGSLYILDEPSIGLHSKDTFKLINVLKELESLGNTVIVVEHDEDIIRSADYLIDLGPDAGRLGGDIVYQGEPSHITNEEQQKNKDSYTIKYLLGTEEIALPKNHRSWNKKIVLKGARMNNLKGIDVEFPLNIFNVVTGVSGSGKSSLVRGILYPALKRKLDEVADMPGEYSAMEGDWDSIKHVEMVNQNPIGKSSRSNPATYVKAFDDIRQLFADQPLSQQMGFTAQYFSFNAEGGRCENCKGTGVITVEMQFMADLELVCDSCHGKRFKKDILDVKYAGKNINDVLEMTVSEAITFFTENKQKSIVNKLKPLEDVGLGYIKLGQSSSTLSGGENQRVKLAYFLGQEKSDPTLFIFDEPTTGLHFHDIKKLLKAFDALIQHGHSVIVIEHNLDIIKCADNIIDLGPDGGDKGGNLVFTGTPEAIIDCCESVTGKYLKDKISEIKK